MIRRRAITKYKRQVLFARDRMTPSRRSQPPESGSGSEQEDDDTSVIELDEAARGFSSVPSLFTALPILRDELQTETSLLQEDTVQECLPYLKGVVQGLQDLNTFGLPKLDRQAHIKYLRSTLEKYPSSYTGFDASRPWCLYWALTGLCMLGEDVSEYRSRSVFKKL